MQLTQFFVPKTPAMGCYQTIGGWACARITHPQRQTTYDEHSLELLQDPHYLLILQLAGRSRVTQLGNTASLDPGDMTIVDPTSSHRVDSENKTICLTLRIPQQELEKAGTDWYARLALRIPRSTAMLVGPILRSSFERLGCNTREQEMILADAIVHLLATGWQTDGVLDADADAINDPPVILGSIQNYVIANLKDDALSPRSIARAHHISERQLHRLFQSAGISVCRWIRECRLDRCAQSFSDRAQRHRSITEIAFSVGFNDAAHFSRLFRAAYGQTPSQYRESCMRPHLALVV